VLKGEPFGRKIKGLYRTQVLLEESHNPKPKNILLFLKSPSPSSRSGTKLREQEVLGYLSKRSFLFDI
jgi:hypothetical protein